MTLRPAVLAILLALAGCAGLDQSVTVLPNTLDDLAAKSAGFRRGRAPAEPRVTPPTPGL